MTKPEPDWFDRFLDTLDRSISGEDLATALMVLILVVTVYLIY